MLVTETDDKEADFFFYPTYSPSCKEHMFVDTCDNSVQAVEFVHSIQVRNVFDFTVAMFGVAQYIN